MYSRQDLTAFPDTLHMNIHRGESKMTPMIGHKLLVENTAIYSNWEDCAISKFRKELCFRDGKLQIAFR